MRPMRLALAMAVLVLLPGLDLAMGFHEAGHHHGASAGPVLDASCAVCDAYAVMAVDLPVPADCSLPGTAALGFMASTVLPPLASGRPGQARAPPAAS